MALWQNRKLVECSILNILLACEYFFANPDFVRLGKELARRGHDVSVATSIRPVDKAGKADLRVFEIKPFVTIYRIPHTISLPLLKISRILKDQNIEVVHTINDHSTNGGVACIAARATNRPFVYTVQGPGTITGNRLVDSVSQLYTMTAGYWCAREAGKVILLSRSLIPTAEKMKVERDRITVVPSGIDSEHFNRGNPEIKEKASALKEELGITDEIVLGYTGRLFPAKGLTYLFSALKRIEKKHPDVLLLLVGDGAQRNQLEMLAKNSKIRTIFAGWQRNVAPYYSLMDIFVLPSLFEGLPNVLLEAMAMNLPLVATSVGGNPDVVQDGKNGFLIPARDDLRLASALERLVNDNDLRLQMGAFSRRKVEEQHQWDKAAMNVERVYREITQVCEPSRSVGRSTLEH
jgi:glycosyltransferase involved in cell wall biosynthesis